MFKFVSSTLMAALLLTALLGSPMAQAQRQGGYGQGGYGQSGQGAGMSLSDAVAMVQQRFNATAVKTDTQNNDGRLIYRIRLLSADRARMWTVNVDAASGQVL